MTERNLNRQKGAGSCFDNLCVPCFSEIVIVFCADTRSNTTLHFQCAIYTCSVTGSYKAEPNLRRMTKYANACSVITMIMLLITIWAVDYLLVKETKSCLCEQLL